MRVTHGLSKANGYSRKHYMDMRGDTAGVRMLDNNDNTDYCGEVMSEENIYYCDKCEKEFEHNEESYEVSYGFICRDCFECF